MEKVISKVRARLTPGPFKEPATLVTKRSTSRGRWSSLLQQIPKRGPAGPSRVNRPPQAAKVSRRQRAIDAAAPLSRLKSRGLSDPIVKMAKIAPTAEQQVAANKDRRARKVTRPGVANHKIERPRSRRRRLEKSAKRVARARG